MTSRHSDARTPDLKDVESGSDADATPAIDTDSHEGDAVPAPIEIGETNQLDDNVDDLGNKAGGGKLEQPTNGSKKNAKP